MVYTKQIIYYSPDNPKIRIACFSDTHHGDEGFARNHFYRWRDKHRKVPQTWFLCLGDNVEAIGPKDKRFTLGHIDKKYRMADNFNALINMQINDFCKDIEPIKDKLLGSARGNHEQKLLEHTGVDVHEIICNRLAIKDLGYSFLMLLTLRQEGNKGRSRSLRIYGMHGWGGGSRTLGGDKTKVGGKLGEYEADIFLFGHSHQAWDEPKPRIGINNNGQPLSKPMIIANTGTFKKSISAGVVPTYSEMRGYPPQYLGGRVIEIEILNHGWLAFHVVE